RGVSAYPAEVTHQMVANFTSGGAAINQLCKVFGVELGVEAMSLERPTGDICSAPAMSEDETITAMRAGMDAVKPGADVYCLGEMGIGNTTPAAAICHALYGGDAGEWTGPGTGLEGQALAAKAGFVAQATGLHKDAIKDPLDVICRLGGRELAAIAGAVIAARFRRIPVILDGYVCTAAAAPLEAFCAGALDHCQVGHVSSEPGHRILLERLSKEPLVDLDMRLGEASGAVLAVGLLKAAAACHSGMATFADAGVSEKP
ncbi:MAG: nicotinate-nucleotide--dimethylbenzimidazole phosphoribosyltransferase, partial [Rhodospirillales bacterium]